MNKWPMHALISALLVFPACEKREKITDLVIETPPGFSGEVHIQTGVWGAPPLRIAGHSYIVSVPSDGHVATSTIFDDMLPASFQNSTGRIWGYASSLHKTGDGIPVGGSIDLFVGTKEQYEIQEAHKHKSEFSQQESPIKFQ